MEATAAPLNLNAFSIVDRKCVVSGKRRRQPAGRYEIGGVAKVPDLEDPRDNLRGLAGGLLVEDLDTGAPQ